jgi:hypothetical protein
VFSLPVSTLRMVSNASAKLAGVVSALQMHLFHSLIRTGELDRNLLVEHYMEPENVATGRHYEDSVCCGQVTDCS